MSGIYTSVDQLIGGTPLLELVRIQQQEGLRARILAKLELSPLEREEAKKDMGRMLDYIDKLNELDTAGVEPMVHVFSMNNVFREDVVTNKDDSDDILKNAPEKKDGAFKVPRTVE